MSRVAPMTELRQRSPRRKSPKHLDMIRQLPCLVCGAEAPVGGGNDAAHIRTASVAYFKRPSGGAEKPSDVWTVPLCRSHHTTQHSMNENEFWLRQNIDPLMFALVLYAHSGDLSTMRAIVMERRT